jgi:2-dehydropantoate 2-reductase
MFKSTLQPALANPLYILGAGAIGSLWATYGYQAGANIRLILRNQATANNYHQHGGTHLISAGQTLISPLAADYPQSVAAPIHKLLITTKTQHTLGALNAIKPHIDEHAILLLLQNGLGIAEQIQREFPQATVLQGSTTEGCYRQSDFEYVHAGHGHTFIGASVNSDKHQQAALAQLAESLSFPPLKVDLCDNIDAVLWRKLAVNCVVNPLTAIHRCRNGELLTRPEIVAQMHEIIDELLAVGAALGLSHWLDDLHEHVANVATATAANRSSMLQDISAGRDTEIDAINGYLCKLADQHNIKVPLNKQLLTEIKSISNTSQV